MSTITIELDQDRLRDLREIASRTGMSEDELVGAAIVFFHDSFGDDEALPPLTGEESASIQRGREQADRGEGVPAEALLADIRARYTK